MIRKEAIRVNFSCPYFVKMCMKGSGTVNSSQYIDYHYLTEMIPYFSKEPEQPIQNLKSIP